MKTRYKVTKQQLEMVVESFVKENSNRRTRRMDETKLNEFMGLGKKIKNLIGTAKKLANNTLSKMSDEEKEELVSIAGNDDVKVLANKLNSLSPEEESEILAIAESVNESSGTIKRIISRLLALVGFPVGLISSALGFFVTGYNSGWSTAGQWAIDLHDMVDASVGSTGGPLSVLLFFISLIFLIVGVVNWNVGKK